MAFSTQSLNTGSITCILSVFRPGRSSGSQDSWWPQGSTQKTFYSQATGGSELSEKPMNVLDALCRSAQRHVQVQSGEALWSQKTVVKAIPQLYLNKGPSVRLLGESLEKWPTECRTRSWVLPMPRDSCFYFDSQKGQSLPSGHDSYTVVPFGVTMPETLQ